MNSARQSPLNTMAAHAVLITYTLIALFPVIVIVINSASRPARRSFASRWRCPRPRASR